MNLFNIFSEDRKKPNTDQQKSGSQFELTKTLAGYLQYPVSGFNWAKGMLSRKENPSDVPSKEEAESVPYQRPGYLLDRRKIDEAWGKYKHNIPDITTVEKTSDIVRTVGEVTGLPQLQWTGIIINKSAQAYKACVRLFIYI